MRAMIVAAAALALAGCAEQQMALAPSAVARLNSATGSSVGEASAADTTEGLRVRLAVHGLPPGTHGAHLHTIGRCDAPDFASAGGHWNPTARRHGVRNPAGPHQGDLPNLIVGADGRGTLVATIPGATLAGLLDVDGAAIVVHAGPDDLMTDPAGNSGARIACGVFGPH